MKNKTLSLSLIACSLCVILGLSLIACVPPQRSKRFEPLVDYYYHEVIFPGENLAAISKWYTGSARDVPIILDHNSGLSTKKLSLGTLVKIPRYLMLQERPMPRSAIGGLNARRVENLTPQETPIASPTPSALNNNSPNTNESVTTTKTSESTPATVTIEPTPNQLAQETPAAVESANNSSATANTTSSIGVVVPENNKRTKSREELLKELTEEY